MNIVFMGTPDFAVPSLRMLIASHHSLPAVVTALDKPQGRGLRISESAVKKVALENNLNILQPGNLNDSDFISSIKRLSPDVIVIVAFRILPKEVFQLSKYGSFNLHASLLPEYRGAAPINWAIINGEKETGVTTFFLKEKVDTGNIIMQNKCEILEDDDAGTLYDKLAEFGAKTVMSTLNLIEMTNGNVPVYSQDESLSSSAPKIFKDMCRISWRKSTENVINFIRGLSPSPGAYTVFNDKIMKIYKARKHIANIPNNGYGSVKLEDSRLFVSCEDGSAEILELQVEGKKRMPASEFLRGLKFQDGFVFT